MRPLAILFFSLICSVACGQIKLVEQISETPETWTGFIKPVLNADGTVTSSAGSKPMLASPSVKNFKYSFETVAPYKFSQLKVKRKATGEAVAMQKDADSSLYSFRSGAVSGVYVFSYTVFDPDKGIDSEDFDVEYKPPVINPGPGPIVVDPPIVNPDAGLTGVAEDSRQVMLGYVRQMAGDMRTAAKELKSGQLKTTLQVQQRGQALDIVARTNFKQSIGALMNKYSVEPPTAELYDSIAIGYEAVK